MPATCFENVKPCILKILHQRELSLKLYLHLGKEIFFLRENDTMTKSGKIFFRFFVNLGGKKSRLFVI